MDYSWLIIFIIISVVSSILSKRKEKQEAERRAREQSGQKPTVAPTAKPSPAAGPPPVAPGPFPPIWKPAPPKQAAPVKPPPRVAEEPKFEEEDPQLDVPARPLFQEMRQELEQRQAREAERPLPPPVFRPLETVTLRAETAPGSTHESAIPAGVGESLAHRLVAETPKRTDTHGAPRRTLTRSTLRQVVIMSELINKPLAIRRQDDSWESV